MLEGKNLTRILRKTIEGELTVADAAHDHHHGDVQEEL
jgi:hypothetical protein